MDQELLLEQFGKYILIKKIATGGMAEIFLAVRKGKTSVVQFVAIKRVLSHLSASQKFKTMFKNEGKITSNLRHSNMVSIHEFGYEQSNYYMAMEYISGCSLKDLLNRIKNINGQLDIPSAVHIVRAISSVLYYIHNSINQETGQPLNLIHRDVSPHNIMIGFNGDIKLIDFGIAKDTEHDATKAGTIKGKFSYMSPEQIQGKILNSQTDLFSLGSVFWELLTGQKLFTGQNITSIIDQIKKGRVYDVSKVRKEVPKVLSDILSSCLRKDLKGRMASAEKLERKLNLFLNKEYPQFSHFDFQNSVKNLYKKEILEERDYFVDISKKLSNRISLNNASWSGTLFDVDLEQSMNAEIEQAPDHTVSKELSSEKSENIEMTTEEKSPPSSSPQQKEPQGDPTVVSPKAPIYYARTNIVSQDKSQESDMLTLEDRVEDIKDDTPQGPATHFSDVVRKARKKRMRAIGGQWAKAFLIIFGIGFAGILFKDELAGWLKFDPTAVSPPKMPAFKFDPLPNDLIDSLEDLEEKTTKRSLAMIKEMGLEEKGAAVSETASEDEIFIDEDSAEGDPSGRKIFIETQPSGGEIYLNGKRMNKKTPALVVIPFQENNMIMIKKQGYKSHVLSRFSDLKTVSIQLVKQKD